MMSMQLNQMMPINDGINEYGLLEESSYLKNRWRHR